jgi:hypothetical protein
MRYSRTISDKDKQLVSENRIQFRGHDITPDSLPGFTLPGNISQHFARDVIVPEATVTLVDTVEAPWLRIRIRCGSGLY